MTVLRTRLACLGVPMLAILLVAAGPTPARASLIVTVGSSAATAGGTGSFDVGVSSTGGTFNLSGFSLELKLASGSGVTFAGVNTTTVLPYLFGTLQSPPFSFNTFPTADFIASDADQSAPGFVSVTPTVSFGLEHVTYSVAAGTVGPISVSIVGLTGQAPTSELDDVNGTPVAFTPVNGTIVPFVPEPSALSLYGIGCFILRVRKRRRGSAVER